MFVEYNEIMFMCFIHIVKYGDSCNGKLDGDRDMFVDVEVENVDDRSNFGVNVKGGEIVHGDSKFHGNVYGEFLKKYLILPFIN